jgi:hypothetical protein
MLSETPDEENEVCTLEQLRSAARDKVSPDVAEGDGPA